MKITAPRFVGAVVASLLLPAVALADDRYWIGSSGDSFSNNTKWSTTAGGANNTTAPGVGSVAYFTTETGATISSAVSVDGIQFSSGFTGTVTASSSRRTDRPRPARARPSPLNMDRSTYGDAGGHVVATTNGRWFYLPRYTAPDVYQ